MQINQQLPEAYINVLHAESIRVITQVQKDAETSLTRNAYQYVVSAYETVMKELSLLPGETAEEIQEANDTFWSEGSHNVDSLKKRLLYLKNHIDTNITIARVFTSVIQLAWENGADISDMLQSIKNYSALIKNECEKLFSES